LVVATYVTIVMVSRATAVQTAIGKASGDRTRFWMGVLDDWE